MIVPIVFSTDHNYIMPTGTAIISLLEKSDDCKPQIYILQSDNVTDDDRSILTSICRKYSCTIKFISIGSIFNKCFEVRGITTASYYRLLIPWLLPEFDKVVYCDGDLVFNKSVSNIYNFNIGDNYVAGVYTGFKLHTHTGAHIKGLGLDVETYINSGVLLINAKKQRELDLKDKFISLSARKFLFQDQDIVNLVCKGHIGLMPRTFNTTPNAIQDIVLDKDESGDCLAALQGFRSPVIIHYAGTKPWKEFTYWWMDWWQNYVKSPFYDPALEYKIERATLSKEPRLRPAFSLFIRRNIPFIGKLVDKLR